MIMILPKDATESNHATLLEPQNKLIGKSDHDPLSSRDKQIERIWSASSRPLSTTEVTQLTNQKTVEK